MLRFVAVLAFCAAAVSALPTGHEREHSHSHARSHRHSHDFGTKVGELRNYQHGIKGTVYVKDEKTITIKDFEYDGQGPDAFFWVGTEGKPSSVGTILPYPFKGKFYEYEDGDAPILEGKFDKVDIILTLPDDLNASDLRWLSVWCRAFRVNFGDIFFPEDFKIAGDDSVAEAEAEGEGEAEGEAEAEGGLPPPLLPPRGNAHGHDHGHGGHGDSDAEPEGEAESEAEAEAEGGKSEPSTDGKGSASAAVSSLVTMAACLVASKWI